MPLGASRIPCSAGPQPHLIPVSCGSSGAGIVMAGETEAQHTQDLKATTSPVVGPGEDLTPIPSIPHPSSSFTGMFVSSITPPSPSNTGFGSMTPD